VHPIHFGGQSIFFCVALPAFFFRISRVEIFNKKKEVQNLSPFLVLNIIAPRVPIRMRENQIRRGKQELQSSVELLSTGNKTRADDDEEYSSAERANVYI
jgi:hypothetical protein